AADDIRPRPDVTSCTRVGSVGDVLTEEGPFDLLIAGPSLGTRAGLARLEVIHDELPGMSVLLAFSRRPEARLREIVRTGDLDLQFGEVSTALRLRPRFTIFDALQRDEEDESALADHIEEYMVKHDTGIYLLAAPKDPSDADRISPPDVTRIIEAIRTRFDYVIVDTPAALP